MKVSSGTCTRPVASRFAFASRFAASGMTLRVMPDARRKEAATSRAAASRLHANLRAEAGPATN